MSIKSKSLSLSGCSMLLVLSACAVTGVGYDETVGVGYVGGFYEPYGYDYGGWGGRYRVGPPRGGDPHGGPRAGGGRGAPSIPSAPRGGGHGGGGHR